MTHSNVYSLRDNDVLFGSWNVSYIVQSAMQNNSETWFSRITTGRVRLNCEMVVSMFAAQGIRNHIGLAKMIVDFQLIILDQF
jgi:hypothetical protein